MKTRETAEIALFTSVILIWLAGLFFFAQSLIHQPKPEADKTLDAIVVLTGGSNRINEGFNLLEKGKGKKLFISGVYRGVDAKELLKLWKEKPQKNLDCCVELGFEAYNTVENAKETITWLKEQQYSSLYLVTSNYHLKRALLEFDKRAPELAISPYPIVPNNIDIEQWWKHSKSRNLVIREYNKFIATYFLHFFLEH